MTESSKILLIEADQLLRWCYDTYIHMLLVSLLLVELALSSTLNPSSPRFFVMPVKLIPEEEGRGRNLHWEVKLSATRVWIYIGKCSLLWQLFVTSESSFKYIFFLDLQKNSSRVICSCVQESGEVSTLSNITSWWSWSPSVRTSPQWYQRPHHMVIRFHQKERENKKKTSIKQPGVFMGLSITVLWNAC